MVRPVYVLILRAAPVAVGLLVIDLSFGEGGTMLATINPALAQTPLRQLPGAVEPGRLRPLPLPPAASNFQFSIENTQRSPVPRAVDELHFLLRDIRIVGAKTLPAARFRPLYAGLIGKQVSLSDILDVADRIEDAYRRAGYVLVRAYVPPQRVANGVFTINVVEGYVAAVSVDGGDAATRQRIEAYLRPVLASRPLQATVIERALLLANDLPGVGASGVLRPSPDVPGASDLVVSIAETPVTGGLSLDNRGSPYSGIWTLGGDVAFNSVFGGGDQLVMSLASSPDSLERIIGQARYRHPVGDDGAFASFIVTVSHGQPGSTLSQLDVLTDSIAVGPRISYPLVRTRAESLQLDAGVTVQDARVSLLGQPFSHDQWRVVDAGVSYLRNGFLGGTWTGGVDLAQGLPIFGATPDGSPELSVPGGHTDFTKVTATVSHLRNLVGPVNLAVAATGQYAFARLIDGEQITFGGTQIGRGYDPGAITGDHGLGLSVELRYDTALPAFRLQSVEPYVFSDTARVWEIGGTGGTDQTIASAGAGIRFALPYHINAGIEFAHTLRAVPGSDNGKTASKLLVDAAVRF